MADSQDIDRIIFLYLSGETNLEEIQELRRWLNTNPHNKVVFEKVAEYWKNSKIEIEAKNKDKAFSILLSRINSHDTDNVRQIGPDRSRGLNTRWKSFRIVAAVVGLLVAAVVAFQFGVDIKYNKELSQEMILVRKQNMKGQKSTIKLPDGSTVWLNAKSSISYPEVFDDNERRLVLEGEAFFDINRDEKRPFIIEIGSTYVSVLGTQLNVKAFPEENVINVALVSGKVKVEKYKNDAHYESIVLEPGEEITYDEVVGQMTKQNFDLEYVTAWRDGTLMLHKDTFSSFIQKLQRWYGVEVKVEGTPSDEFVVTGKFHNESMENVLRTLQFSRDFEFTIEDKLLTIKFEYM